MKAFFRKKYNVKKKQTKMPASKKRLDFKSQQSLTPKLYPAASILSLAGQHTWFRKICKLSMRGAISERLP